MLPILSFGLVFMAAVDPATAECSPPVKELLRLSVKPDNEGAARFFDVLSAVAMNQVVETEVTRYESGRCKSGEKSARLSKGRAVLMWAEEQPYVVVILGSHWAGMPSVEAQKVILLDKNGRILDQIAAAINSRYGKVVTHLTTGPPGRSEVTIRVQPWRKGGSHNWHTITYHKKAYTFDVRPKPGIGEVVADPDLVCRFGIEDSRFKVLSPDLVKPDFGDE